MRKIVALLIGVFAIFAVSAMDPPNVVFILADDLGVNDLSLYGSTFHETPNIDALADKGMKFTQAYAANPLCSPTRASIMTGLYPSRIGITTPVCHLNKLVLDKQLEESAPPNKKSLNAVFSELGKSGVRVLSMRNKANRLEELFLRLVDSGASS